MRMAVLGIILAALVAILAAVCLFLQSHTQDDRFYWASIVLGAVALFAFKAASRL